MSKPAMNVRISGLDGLRGISILLVIMCHASWFAFLDLPKNVAVVLDQVTLPLGYFGVPIFFVISGFIITHLLLREEKATGLISLKKFWAKRFIRIIPPILLYITFIIAYAAFNKVRL